MAQALPIHIVSEIERRWQRRLDSQPQAKPGKNDDRSAGSCPLCGAPASVKPAIPGSIATWREYVCDSCGHAWQSETY